MIEANRISKLELSLIRRIVNSAPEGSINLALGELGYPFPEKLRQEAIRIVSNGSPRYTPNAGLEDLRAAIAGYYENRISPNQVCVTGGAEEAIYTLLTALINRDDAVAIPDPDYPAYQAIATIMEARVVRLPYERDLLTIDWDKWEALLSGNVKLLILSNPKNPTGLYFSADERKRLFEICTKHNVIIAVDEIYKELHLDSDPGSMCNMGEQVFVISGLSKSHLMSGWRLGWIVSPSGFAASIVKTRQYISTCANWIAQKLAIYALSSEGMSILPLVRQMLCDTQTLAVNALQERYDTLL
ncbi:MAG: pyridoxal phosphate-dependent aminotransferase, partial [Candidatus Cloacimonadaceae bacterium]|nr:pyridoxal phosphate-dependent aminotransferase [Candidatus Cloacimonadaceae bacterium]